MFSKRDYQMALKKLGFKQDKNSKTSGSHTRYSHSKYKNIIVGIDDHKDTKEMPIKIHQELIKSMSLLVWIECRNSDGSLDYEKATAMLELINKEMANEIMAKLKTLDYRSDSFLLKLLSKKLVAEISKSKPAKDNVSILDYILN